MGRVDLGRRRPVAAILPVLLLAAACSGGAVTTTTFPPPSAAGIWFAEPAGGLPTQVTLSVGASGSVQGTVDFPYEGIFGWVVSGQVTGDRVSLEVPEAPAAFEGRLSADGGTLSGILRLGEDSLPIAFERRDTPFAFVRPQEPQPPFPYRVEEVTFTNRRAGFDLAGTLTLPEGPGPFPAAILISGSGSQDRDEALLGHKPFLVLADALARRGVAVLRFDDRGAGRSGGDPTGATSADLAGDAAAALDYLLARPEAAAGAVGLIGHSEGGLIGPMLAATRDDVAFLVLLAGPGVAGVDLLYSQTELLLRAEGLAEDDLEWQLGLLRPVLELAAGPLDDEEARAELRAIVEQAYPGMPAGAARDLETLVEATLAYLDPWMRYFLAYDPVPALRAVRVPVLALNGEKDLQVPAAANLAGIAAALAAGGNPDVTVRELPGLNHLFQTAATGAVGEYAIIEETMSPTVLDLVAEWILSRFGD